MKAAQEMGEDRTNDWCDNDLCVWLGHIYNRQTLSRDREVETSVIGDSTLSALLVDSKTALRSVSQFSCREADRGLSTHAVQSGWSGMSREGG